MMGEESVPCSPKCLTQAAGAAVRGVWVSHHHIALSLYHRDKTVSFAEYMVCKGEVNWDESHTSFSKAEICWWLSILELNYEAPAADVREDSIKVIIIFRTSCDVIYFGVVCKEAVGNLKIMVFFYMTQSKEVLGKNWVVMFNIWIAVLFL